MSSSGSLPRIRGTHTPTTWPRRERSAIWIREPSRNGHAGSPGSPPPGQNAESGPGRGTHFHVRGLPLLVVLAALSAVPAISGLAPRITPVPALLLLQGATALLLPGWLISRLLGIRPRQLAESMVYAAALSVVLLMVVGLAANAIFPLLGYSHPLTPDRLGPCLSSVELVLLVVLAVRDRPLAVVVPRPTLSLVGFALYGVPVALVVGAVLGAIQLNNGGSNAVAAVMLVVTILYLAAILFAPRLPSAVFPFALYVVGLALLLQLSLRGNVLSGHDILFEYKVFQATEHASRWRPAIQPTAYSACLSITILPVLLHDLVWVSGSAVFRILIPALFALSPVVVFLILRRFVTERAAFAGGLFFIAQSPFLGDFPFLARQEIALLVFGVLILSLLATARHRLVLCVALSIGLVLSHYSTTYVAIAIVGAAVAVFGVMRLWRQMRSRASGPETAGGAVDRAATGSGSWVGLVAVLAVMLAGAIVWTGVVTRSSGNLQHFVDDLSFPRPPSLSLLLAGHNKTPTEGSYVYSVTHPAQAAPGAHYPAQALTAAPSSARHPDAVPTRLPVSAANAIYRVGSVIRDVVKVLLFLGALVLLLTRRRTSLPAEFLSLLVGAAVVLVAALVLPTVSVQYDPGRVYQQTLIVLTLPFVAGAAALAAAIRIRREQLVLGAAALTAYLAVTPVVPEIVGSGYANMQLNNYGPYYASYYVRGQEVRAVQWLDRYASPTVPIYADWFNTRKLSAFSRRPIWVVSNVVPTNIVRRSYVFGSVTNMRTQTAYGDYYGAMVTYPFPARLSDVKDVVFSAGGVRVWR